MPPRPSLRTFHVGRASKKVILSSFLKLCVVHKSSYSYTFRSALRRWTLYIIVFRHPSEELTLPKSSSFTWLLGLKAVTEGNIWLNADMPKYLSNTSYTNVYTVGFLNMLADSIFCSMPIAFSKLDYQCLDPMSNFTLHFSFFSFGDKFKPTSSFSYSFT